jgi:intracellular septation protein A
MATFNVYAAVFAALAWMFAATCWRKATGKPVSRLLLLTIGILTIRSAFTLATGNTFVYFVQPVFADAAVAALFLGSLCTTRPLVARLAPDFCPMDDSLTVRPRVQRLFRQLTLLWGLVVIAKGTTTLWLLLTLPTDAFVLIKSIAIIGLTLLAALATVALSATVGRQEGLWGRAA